MRIFTGVIYKRVSLFALSLILAVSSLSVFGTAIFPVAVGASATPTVVYTPVNFNSLTWGADRSIPSGGYSIGSDSLSILIDNQNPNPLTSSSTFYKTEGLQAAISSSRAIKADLLVDADWSTKPVRAGIWATAYNNDNSDMAWPLIEYTNIGEGGFVGWRVFDTINGGWTNLVGVGANYGSTYTLEIRFNTLTKDYDYYVNGSLVLTHDGNWLGDGYGNFKSVILNSYNSITGNPADNYSVSWHNLAIGREKLDTPAGLRLNNVNGEFTCGLVTNVNNITPTWNAVPGATSYNYKVTLPNGTTYGPTNVGNVTSVTGPFGGEGLSTFSVRAANGGAIDSDWATSCAVTYDATSPVKPTLLTTANNGYETTNNFYFTWTDASDSGSQVKYEFQSSASNTVDGNGSLVGAWNSITNGNSEQSNLTTPKIHSVGAPDGTYYWQVRSIDAAGNKSAWTLPWKMTIDSVVPGTPTTTLSAGGVNVLNNGYTKSKTFTFNLSSSVDTTRYQLKYWNDIVGSPFKQSSPWNPTNLSSYSSSLGVYSDQFTQGEGKHYFAFSSCDVAGNCSAYSTPFVVTYDKTAPLVNITSPSSGDTVKGEVIVSGSVTDNNPHHYYLVIKNQHGSVVAGPGTVNANNVSDWVWDTTLLADGQYVVNLEARDAANNKNASSSKTITVTVDNNAPAITVTGGDFTIESGSTYVEQGATWMDYIDGLGDVSDISGTVDTTTPGEYTITYSVTDNAGNTSTATRTVTVEDTTKPVITLNGQSTLALTVGDTFTDPGATTDDGSTVVVTGSVNTAVAGSYTLSYDTTDGYGNVADTVKRIVIVSIQPVELRSSTSTDSTATGDSEQSDTENTQGKPEILGSETTNNTNSQNNSNSSSSDSVWNLFEIAWYWWLLIAAAVGSGWWIISAAIGRSKD